MSFRTIAVVLGNNDFDNTSRHLLDSIYATIIHRGDEAPLTFEDLCHLIFLGAEFHYLAYQSREAQVGEVELNRVLFYLKGKMRILVDTDAEAFIATNDHDRGSWYLEVATGKTYAF